MHSQLLDRWLFSREKVSSCRVSPHLHPPAATTTVTPSAVSLSIASHTIETEPLPPRLMLTTLMARRRAFWKTPARQQSAVEVILMHVTFGRLCFFAAGV